MNYKRRIAALFIVASMLSTTGCSMDEFFNGKSSSNENQGVSYSNALAPQVHQLIADDVYKPIDDEEGITFETAVNESEVGSEVALYDENSQKVADFYDDGTNGDRVAGDRIYTCNYRPDVSDEKEQSFTVKTGDEESEPIKVRYFDELTNEDFDKAQEVNKAFMDSVAEFKDADGIIKKGKSEEAFAKAAEVAETLLNNGDALKYEVNEKYNNIVIKLSSGITYVYNNLVDGTESDALAKSALDIHTYQPCKNGVSTVSVDDVTTNIEDELNNISFSKKRDGVTRDDIKSFGSNQIIIWNGHGGYSPTLHSFIVIGENDKLTETRSDDDYIKDRLILCGNSTDFSLAFTYKFVDKYVGDMTNTLLYMGCCETAHDSVLASSFINKNCNLYIGFSDSVLANYNRKITKSFFRYLSKEKTVLFTFKNGYRTAYEAMEEAKDDCGKESKYVDDNGYTHLARPIMFGNTLFKLSDDISNDIDYENTTVIAGASGSLKLDKTYVSLKKGESVEIAVASYPKGYNQADLVWTIDNTNIASCTDGTITGIEKGIAKLHIETSDGNYDVECAVSVN